MSTSSAYQTATGSLVPLCTGSKVPQLSMHNISLTGRYLIGYMPLSAAKSFSASNKLQQQAIGYHATFCLTSSSQTKKTIIDKKTYEPVEKVILACTRVDAHNSIKLKTILNRFLKEKENSPRTLREIYYGHWSHPDQRSHFYPT